MHETIVLNRNNDENETNPKARKSLKLKHILKQMWKEKDILTGNGIGTII